MPFKIKDILDINMLIDYDQWWKGIPWRDVQNLFVNPEHLFVLRQLWHHLIIRAREAALEAKSYRGFNVGCAVLAYKSGTPFKSLGYRIFTGYNKKSRKDDPGECAEYMAIEAAEREGFELIIAMAISGISQDDHRSGLRPITLHPCGKCRRMFRKSALIRNDTFVITIHREEWIYEINIVKEILDFHRKAKK